MFNSSPQKTGCSCVRIGKECDGCDHDFLSNVSHELRTPLTTLTGYGELLLDGVYGELNSGQSETVERMRVVAQKMSNLIESLLTYANLQAEKERVRIGPEYLVSEVVSDALLVVEPNARKAGVSLEGQIEDPMTVMSIDRDKVRQILVYLLENAIKFSANEIHSKETVLRAHKDGEYVVFTIVDNGIGIPSENHGKIFEAFVQLDTGLTRQHGGIGLGLYLAKQLALLVDGNISVESEPGFGSKFTFTVPAAFSPLLS